MVMLFGVTYIKMQDWRYKMRLDKIVTIESKRSYEAGIAASNIPFQMYEHGPGSVKGTKRYVYYFKTVEDADRMRTSLIASAKGK